METFVELADTTTLEMVTDPVHGGTDFVHFMLEHPVYPVGQGSQSWGDPSVRNPPDDCLEARLVEKPSPVTSTRTSNNATVAAAIAVFQTARSVRLVDSALTLIFHTLVYARILIQLVLAMPNARLAGGSPWRPVVAPERPRPRARRAQSFPVTCGQERTAVLILIRWEDGSPHAKIVPHFGFARATREPRTPRGSPR